MTREVPLSQGLVALVDEDDYEQITAAGRWLAQRSKTNIYARRNVRRPDGTRTVILLHTFLTGWPLVDHINGNGLDNRRLNLRPATITENVRNQRLRRNSTSGFKGVRWHQTARKWHARIKVDEARQHLGLFATAEEAARAYDAAARAGFGEFAALNFPLAGERGAR